MKQNIFDYSFEIDGPHEVEWRTEIKIEQLARKIVQYRRTFYTFLHLDALEEVPETIAVVDFNTMQETKEFLDQTCFAGSVSIIKFLFGFKHPVGIDTLCEVTQLDEIDVKERLDWLEERKLIEMVETGFQISADFKQNSLSYRIQVESNFGNNFYNKK